MEEISFNNLGESDFECIDYITFSNLENDYMLDLKLLTGLSLTGLIDQNRYATINMSVKIRNGIGLFYDWLRKEAYNKILFTAQCSNYHGSKAVFTATIIAVERDIIFPGIFNFRFKVMLPLLSVASDMEEEKYITRL